MPSGVNSEFNIAAFDEMIRLAPTSELHEKMVRQIVSGVCKSCPLALLLVLAEEVYKFRRKEMNDEAASN